MSPPRGPKQDHAVQAQQKEYLAPLYGLDALGIVEGYITDVVAGQRVYKVDIAGAQLSCRDISVDAGMHPLGPIKLHIYQIGTKVLVLRSPNNRYGFIIGATSFLVGSNKMNLVVPIAPFTGADAANDVAHYYPIQMAHAGGVHDYNSGRPYDAIPGSDAGVINELGVGYGVSRYFSWLRSSDFSGLWCFYLDMLVRMCAYNWEFLHSGGEHWIKNDEGEIDEFKWITPYPWEALGLRIPGAPAIQEAEGGGWYKPGQKDNRYKPMSPQQMGIGRHFRWGGYLGDLSHEVIAVPEQTKVPDEENRLSTSNYTGVLSIQKMVDGTYAIRSARQVLIEKYSVIPVPKQISVPEEAKDLGDSPTNYKAAGQTGAGEAHTKKPWEFSEEDAPLTWLCELQDYHSYMFNFYGFVPVIRHEKDWYLPEASESGIGQGKDPATYTPAPLGSNFAIPPPKTVTLRVDHRTDAVKYYLSRSFVDLMPDGSVILGDGYGSTIMMSQGHIYLDAVGDIFLKPGRNLVTMAGSDVNLKAGKSMDLSAAKRDVRIKAEKNLHMLAGNSAVNGGGGILLEARSPGTTYKFDGVVGEDVQSSGIIFKAKDSQILGYARDVYLRTQEGGKLTLDAAGGKGERVDIGGQITRIGIQFTDIAGEELEDGEFTTDAVSTNVFNKDLHTFGANGLVHFQAQSVILSRTQGDSQLGVDGTLVCSGDTIIEKNAQIGKSVAIFGSCIVKGSQIASSHANMAGAVGKLREKPLKDEDPPEVRDDLEEVATTIEDFEAQQIEGVPAPLQDLYYADDTKVGHEDFREALGFSFRNDEQYGVVEMALPEAMYQQVYRANGSGVVYEEPEVDAPWGETTLPYPGVKAWEEDESFVINDSSLFDPATGRAKDRNDSGYEAAKGSGVKRKILKGNYRVTKQE